MEKWQRARIEYKKCKVFNDGFGGRLYHEIDKNGKPARCCLGAYDMGDESQTVLNECRECKKYIQNI